MNLKSLNILLLVLIVLTAAALVDRGFVRRCFRSTSGVQKMKGEQTVGDRIDQYGDIVCKRLAEDFKKVGVCYPPKKMVLIGLKEERILEVWVSGNGADFSFLRSYPILGASGRLGPKRERGDLQVPEGLYKIESLNPNSRFHLSLRVNYPNEFDKRMANLDARTDLGGDIMIHGSTGSIGCLAMGDQAAEDLFVLAALTKANNISVILSPVDFRAVDVEIDLSRVPDWVPDLYDKIKTELLKFK